MRKRITFYLIVLLLLGNITGYSQQATTSSGGEGKGPGGFVSWSTGQVAYTGFTGKGGINTISSGVQQAYAISVIGFRNAISISYSVYPNPVTDNLILETPNFKTGKISYQLLDMQGNLMKNALISGNRTEIDTKALPAATYFLQIIQGDKQVQTFKIIKN